MSSKLVASVIFTAALAVSTSSALPFNGTSAPALTAARAGLFSYERYIVFNHEQLPFFEAWQSCQSLGLQLATINSAADDAELRFALLRAGGRSQPGPWWVGATDLVRTGQFMWISRHVPVGYPSGYTNWAQGQPDNAGGVEHCMEVGWPTGTLWNDRPCDTPRRFICENN